MKFFKKNKFTIIAIIIFILLVYFGVEIRNFLVPDKGKAVYGDRLNGIENYPISDDFLEELKTKLKENEKVLETSSIIHGKIINFIITVSDDVSINDAKGIANSLIPMFVNDELSYYSLQVYLVKNNSELNNFPIIGYKDIDSESLSFTKDREITTGEENEE